MADAKYLSIKEAAEQSGMSCRYLRGLYCFPGQDFIIKADPRKKNSKMYIDLSKFYKWQEKMNKRGARV